MTSANWAEFGAGARLGGFISKKGVRFSALLGWNEEKRWHLYDAKEDPVSTQPIQPPVKLRNALPRRPRRDEYLPAVRVSTAEAEAARVFLGARAWATVARELVCSGGTPIAPTATPAGTATVDKQLRYHVGRIGNNLNQLTCIVRDLVDKGQVGGAEVALKDLADIRTALEALLK